MGLTDRRFFSGATKPANPFSILGDSLDDSLVGMLLKVLMLLLTPLDGGGDRDCVRKVKTLASTGMLVLRFGSAMIDLNLESFNDDTPGI